MYVLDVGLFNPVKLKINSDEQYIEIMEDEPIKYPYNDTDDIINIIEQYTLLSQYDIQRIYECADNESA
jgi:hypothetical protein